MELGDQLRDQWERVLVLDGDRIKGMVVLEESKVPILLFDEEDRGCHWRLGRSDTARIQVFLEKGV